MRSNRATLVIGSSGFLGRVLTDRLRQQQTVIPTHYESPIFPGSLPFDLFSSDPDTLFGKFDIGTVIVCAAFEDEEVDAVKAAAQRLLGYCREKRVVYLSSDGIFSGEQGNYSETDLPRPTTHYGRNLATCEALVRASCPDHLIVRPSYIYGFSHGRLDSRLAPTRSALEAGETVTLYRDMYKSPLGVAQVAEAVASLSMGTLRGTLHVAGARLSVFAFQLQAMRALGQDTRRLLSNSVLEGSKVLRDTSLDALRWQTLSGTQPLSVAQVLVDRGSVSDKT